VIPPTIQQERPAADATATSQGEQWPQASAGGAEDGSAATQASAAGLGMPPPVHAPRRSAGAAARSRELIDRATRWLASSTGCTLLCAVLLCVVAFVAGGGLRLAPLTGVEMALTIVSGLLLAAVVFDRTIAAARARAHAGDATTTETLTVGTAYERPWAADSGARPLYGIWSVVLLLALAALSALSVAWSVEPDASWQDAGRLVAYGALFAAALALARLAPHRWAAVLGGVTLAALVISSYALLTKIFPAQLGASETYARLQQPYGYWVATGLTAAMGAMGCLWLGARRDGHALLRALAYPAMGLALTTLMLTYSRGPVVALAIGLVLWFCVVPLRLRGAAVLIAGALGAAVVVGFDFSNHALSSEAVPLAQRNAAGHQLGALLAAVLVVLALAGVAIGFLTSRRAPRARERRIAGAALLAVLAAAVLAVFAGLGLSHRGFTGTISHDWNTLTNPNASSPENTPNRLTAIASVRARYWNEALEIYTAHPVLGVGAGGYATARLRYRTETLNVRHAHGYIVQTLAELGVVGLVVTLALLAVWLVAAGRATHPFNRRWRGWRWRRVALPYTPERIALLSMLSVVVVFGAHSLVDWTWYVPGVACAALLCAGWLAGRGPIEAAAGSPARSATAHRWRGVSLRGLSPAGVGIAAAILVVALLAAWAQWQPERSASASEQALSLISREPRAARAAAQAAVSEDPDSLQALRYLAAVQQAAGESAIAEKTLQEAVHLQPANPQSWSALAEHDLALGNYPAAVNEFRAAVYLNPEIVAPESVTARDPELLSIRNEYLQALRATGH
jgi:O-antigen ligase